MSGRALIIVVTGIIIISSIILYQIGAASNNLVANVSNYYLRQTAQDIAQSGVNLALTQLGNDRTWRTGFPLMNMFGGKVTVSVFDTSYGGVSTAIGIRAIGYTQYNTPLQRSAFSSAFVYYPPALKPISVRALMTLNGPNSGNGNAVMDAREHDVLGNVIPNSGTYAFWSTSTFSPSGSLAFGGTAGGVDYAPPGKGGNAAVIDNNQVYPGGFPMTPDSAVGGPAKGYPEGTLKAIAQSGLAGSQYVTDPSKLTFPMSGVTYVELPSGSTWNTGSLSGSGILVVHNATGDAVLKNPGGGTFQGLVIADDITLLHLTMLGAMIVLTTSPSGNSIANGNATIMYSTDAILNATKVLTNGNQLHVISWWE